MKQKVYSVEVQIYATLYVKAASPEEATHKAKLMKGECISVDSDHIDDRPYAEILKDSNEYAAFSPMMTIGKHVKRSTELAEEQGDGE